MYCFYFGSVSISIFLIAGVIFVVVLLNSDVAPLSVSESLLNSSSANSLAAFVVLSEPPLTDSCWLRGIPVNTAWKPVTGQCTLPPPHPLDTHIHSTPIVRSMNCYGSSLRNGTPKVIRTLRDIYIYLSGQGVLNTAHLNVAIILVTIQQ